jgi:hypothetical protein
MNIIFSIVRALYVGLVSLVPIKTFHTVALVFCYRCHSCGWKKEYKKMKNNDICWDCACGLEKAPQRKKPIVQRVNIAV